MTTHFRIAGVQMDVRLADTPANLQRMTELTNSAADQGARLVIFPECALTGYCFESLEEGAPLAEDIPGPSTARMQEVCRRRNVHVVYGLLEACRVAGVRGVFNALALVGPQGVVASYRKIHLPHLGIDHFSTPGDRPFGVYDVEGVKVGLAICYDSAFPESARVMALQGADLVALPTNFPPGSECVLDHVVHARAMENAIYFAAVNRVGTERGFRFLGGSKICDPDGKQVAVASPDAESILLADVDLARTRDKRRVRVPGRHFIDRFADRRPEMYGPIAER